MPTANLFLVTETLRRLLDLNVRGLLFRDGLPTTLTVTTMPPERVGAATNTLNLHLYHLMEDAFYKNVPPPGSGAKSIHRQPLALSLFYILTAHHEMNDVFDAEIQQQLMGLALKTFHDFPVIDESLQISPGGGPPQTVLSSGLAGRQNRIELSLRPLTPEEALTFWSAEQTSTARLAAYYEVRTIFLEPEEPETVSGTVVDLGVFVFAGLGPSLSRSIGLSQFTPPAASGLGVQTIDLSPARATLAPGMVPAVNRVRLEGSGLTGDARPGSAQVVLRTPSWLQQSPPMPVGPVDPQLNPGWGVVIEPALARLDFQPQLLVDDGSGGIIGLEVVPGIYAASVRNQRQTATAGGVVRTSTPESNQVAFSVGARIVGFDPPPGPGQRMVLRVFDAFDMAGPQVQVQLAIDGILYTETTAFENDPLLDLGLFMRLAGGRLEFQPIFDPAQAGAHPVRLVINGAESQPFWIETP